MEVDDDFVVVIIEDEQPSIKRKQSLHIKHEVNDEDHKPLLVEELIETAEKHGQMIKIENIKKEIEDYEELGNEYDDTDEDYTPDWAEVNSEDDEFHELKYEHDNSEDDGGPKRNAHRYKMLRPSEQKSFVKDLQQQYPELKKDKELLIETLCEIMLSIKPPTPPKDFFLMNDIQFECALCGFLSESIPAASRHYREKHGERYLVCFACGVDFRSTTNLYKHEKRCNAPDAVTVLKARALSLGRKGRGRPFLPRPEMIKLREKFEKKTTKRKKVNVRLLCSMCPAVFSSKVVLKSHQLAHSGARPYRCSKCPAAYTSRSGLSRHFTKHTDIQFICDHCSRPFKSKTALIAHLDTHKPLRKYPCETCGRRFAQRMAMQLHADRTHRNLPPPCACQICPRRYPRMSLLKTHMLKAHGMNLITRKMFYKSLPMLSETEIQQAKIVLKSELERNEVEYQNVHYEPTRIQKREVIAEQTPTEVIYENAEVATEEADLSEEVMQHLKKIQQGDLDKTTKFIIVENGEITCVDDSNIDNYRSHLAQVEAAFETSNSQFKKGEAQLETQEAQFETPEAQFETAEVEFETDEAQFVNHETQFESGEPQYDDKEFVRQQIELFKSASKHELEPAPNNEVVEIHIERMPNELDEVPDNEEVLSQTHRVVAIKNNVKEAKQENPQQGFKITIKNAEKRL